MTRLQLNKALRNTGLMFPVDPGADATIGGMTATRASGTTAVRYGTMRENVLGLTVVLADGRVIRTGTRARKSSAGYDLTRLFVGSEGTLGVITEVTLRLHPLPEAVSAAVCAFESIAGRGRHRHRHDSARRPGRAHRAARRGADGRGEPLLEDAAIPSRRRCSSSSTATAIAHVADQAEAVQALAAERGGRGFAVGDAPGGSRAALAGAARRALRGAGAAPGLRARGRPTSACRSRGSPIASSRPRRINAGAPFPICLVGHAGDGNFHVIYLLDPASEAELAEARRLNERMVTRALAMGGTCTGEHGVGYGKMKYLESSTAQALEVMRTIKRALDPDNRMNPGKVLDLSGGASPRDRAGHA